MNKKKNVLIVVDFSSASLVYAAQVKEISGFLFQKENFLLKTSNLLKQNVKIKK